MRVWQTDEFIALVARSRLIVEDFGVIPALLGARLQRGMAQYLQEVAALS